MEIENYYGDLISMNWISDKYLTTCYIENTNTKECVKTINYNHGICLYYKKYTPQYIELGI